MSAPAATARAGEARPRVDLDDLAATAQRAFAGDAVVVELTADSRARRSARGRAHVAAADGLTKANAEDLQRGLAQLRGALEWSGREAMGIPFLAGTRLAGAKIVLSHGFAAVLCAPVVHDDRCIGAVYALKHEPGPFSNEPLIAAFARQVSIAVVGGRVRRGGLASSRLDGLAALDELVLSAGGLRELSRAIDEAIAPLFGDVKTGIMIWDERRELLQMIAGSFGAGEEITLSCQVNPLDPRSSSARVFTSGQPYFSNDPRSDRGIVGAYLDAFAIDSLLSAPLAIADRPIGVLHVANKRGGFSVDDLPRAEFLASRIAGAVEVARTLSRLRRQQRLEEVLAGVAVAVASGESAKDFLVPALEGLGEAVGASLLILAPTDEQGQHAVWRSGATPLERVVLEEMRTKPGMRAYVVAPDGSGDPGWAVFYAPVHLGQQRVGTIAALRTRGEPFEQDERRAIVRLASLAALSVATERYQQQRAELARLHERQRIADDLHDDVAQILFAAQLNLDAILERDELDPLTTAGIERALGLLIRGDAAIREVIHQLSKSGTGDFGERLAAVVASVEEEFSIAIHMHVEVEAVEAAKRLRKAVCETLIKVARESLVNAAKHAGPCRVSVIVTYTDRGRLLLTVLDDGVGRAAVAGDGGHGLASLRRAIDGHGGCLRIASDPDSGTKVTASVAVPQQDIAAGERRVGDRPPERRSEPALSAATHA